MVIHVEVRGVVQGVGFRWFAREKARELSLAGWVRNHEDGHVEIAASGDNDEVRRFLRALERGPAGAVVDEVRPLPTGAVGELPSPFTIVR